MSSLFHPISYLSLLESWTTWGDHNSQPKSTKSHEHGVNPCFGIQWERVGTGGSGWGQRGDKGDEMGAGERISRICISYSKLHLRGTNVVQRLRMEEKTSENLYKGISHHSGSIGGIFPLSDNLLSQEIDFCTVRGCSRPFSVLFQWIANEIRLYIEPEEWICKEMRRFRTERRFTARF